MSNPLPEPSKKAYFLKALTQFKQQMPIDPLRQSLFLEGLRFNFSLAQLPDFESIQNFFTLINESRPFAFKTKWLNEEIILLVWTIFHLTIGQNQELENLTSEDWENIALLFQDRTSKQCMFKFFNLLRSNPIKKENKWNSQEDAKLYEIASKFQEKKQKFKWTRIAYELYERTGKTKIRMGKHCRERWNNHLNPNLNKGKWSDQEDLILLRNVSQKGKKWARISRLLQGRNEYAVKNRFYFLMKKHNISSSSRSYCQEVKNLIKLLSKNSSISSDSPLKSISLHKKSKHIKKAEYKASNKEKTQESKEIKEIKEEKIVACLNSPSKIKIEHIVETQRNHQPEILQNNVPSQISEEKKLILERNQEINEGKLRELEMIRYWQSMQEATRMNNFLGMNFGMNSYPMNFMAFRQNQMQLAYMKTMMDAMKHMKRPDTGI